jgi:hypothetical protein
MPLSACPRETGISITWPVPEPLGPREVTDDQTFQAIERRVPLESLGGPMLRRLFGLPTKRQVMLTIGETGHASACGE